MAEKKPLIVIKKITIEEAGAHGGSWKVAFADFMTAMMAFFLVMWLLSQSDQTKKNVADYFSTPSVIEYNFSAFGVELTLEKLFLDLMNEPLSFLRDFMQPMDYTPNIMALGSKNIVTAMVSEDIGDYSKNIEVNPDELVFELPERFLFDGQTAEPSAQFVTVMERVKKLTAGLEDSIIYVDSLMYGSKGPDQNLKSIERVAEGRLELVTKRVQSTLEHTTVDVFGRATAELGVRDAEGKPLSGMIRFRIKQKELRADGSKQRTLGEVFGAKADGPDVYGNFGKKLTQGRKAKPAQSKEATSAE